MAGAHLDSVAQGPGINMPVGGLFTGADGIKTAEQAATYGGIAGEQYDPCYHLACDTYDNVSLAVLDQTVDAAAHVIQTLAMTGNTVPSERPKLPDCGELGYDFAFKIDPEYCRRSPSYWSRNPEAWPIAFVDVGDHMYSRDAAIAVMETKAKGDKSFAMFAELVAAKLNLITCGHDSGAIGETIAAADLWVEQWPPGSAVKGNHPAWDDGAPLFSLLSNFNGGMFQSGSYPINGCGEVLVEIMDGIYFDWSATRSADAVIVKGGRGAALAHVGQAVTYEYEIANVGSANSPALILDQVVDTPLGDLTDVAEWSGCGRLAVAASCAFQISYPVAPDDPDPLVNVVEVLYHPEGCELPVSDTDDNSIDLLNTSVNFTLTQPGPYALVEETRAGWTAIGPTSYDFVAQSGASLGPFVLQNREEVD